MPRFLQLSWQLWQTCWPAVVTVLVGVLALGADNLLPLSRLSYDLLFLVRSSHPVPDVVLVYVTDDTFSAVGADPNLPLPREHQIKLLERLQQDHPRLVFYDFIFSTANAVEEIDVRFAAEIRTSGNVILGAAFTRNKIGDDWVETSELPLHRFRDEARGWGSLTFDQVGPDGAVRQFATHTLMGEHRTSVWSAAVALSPQVTNGLGASATKQWLRYYGAPGQVFKTLNFDQAMDLNQVPSGFFHDKLVFVGPNRVMDERGRPSDKFATPWSRCWQQSATGTEIHAVTLMNLLRGDSLGRMGAGIEFMVVVLWGVGAVLVLFRLPMKWAIGTAVGGVFLLLTGSLGLMAVSATWWGWLIPALQTPLALGLSAWVNRGKIGWAVAVPIPPPAMGPPEVFLSYRRKDASDLAGRIWFELRAVNVVAWVDIKDMKLGTTGIDDLNEATFPIQLERSISSIPSFLLLLTPGALEALNKPDSWVARELRYAKATSRNILVLHPHLAAFRTTELLKEVTLLDEFEWVRTFPGIRYEHDQAQASLLVVKNYLPTLSN